MYSETAVRMSSNQMTDEGFDQRCTLLSHLSYVPGKASGDGGTRTHNPRITNHVLQSAVDHVSVATKVLVRGISARESNPPTATRSADSLDGADIVRTGSRRCIQCPTKWRRDFRSYRSRWLPTVGTRQTISERCGQRSRVWIAPASATLGSS